MAKKTTKPPHPKYPIFIPSLGRADNLLTAKMFLRDGVEFKIVVQPDQVEAYAEIHGADRLLVLPEDGKGLVYARNWIKDYAVASGAERHWQFDDDIRRMVRLYDGYRIPCSSRLAIACAEEFTDRYENVALTSFNSLFFVPATDGVTRYEWPPFYLNHRCYTCFLMMNSLPNRWRFRYNEDTDMTLQVLADGWCTILFNAFLIQTPTTMTDTGGQTDIYINDGRLKMARDLERVWPGVVRVNRRFRRPQHIVKESWRRFDNQLIRKKGIRIKKGTDEHGMSLIQKQEPKAENLKRLYENYDAE